MSETSLALREIVQSRPALPETMVQIVERWQVAFEKNIAWLEKILRLSDLKIEVHMHSTNLKDFASADDQSGFIFPLVIDTHTELAAFTSSTSAKTISDILLTTHVDEERNDVEASTLDNMLAEKIVRLVTNMICEQVDSDVQMASDHPTHRNWPKDLIENAPKNIQMTLIFRHQGDDLFEVLFFLPSNSNFYGDDSSKNHRDAVRQFDSVQRIPIQLAAYLDVWATQADSLNGITLGSTLHLPNASLDNIKFFSQAKNGLTLIATGEHGRSGQSQAVRIKKKMF